MTRTAPEENREQRRAEIVQTALRLLEEDGIERLSLRRVAQALRMHPPGLYWYIESKQELIDLLAKAILDEALAARGGLAPGETWEGWLTDTAVAIWRAMVAHRDGARVVAGAYLFRTHALSSALETALEILEAAGFARPVALHGTITVMRYSMGIALDGQASPPVPPVEALGDGRVGPAGGPYIDTTRWPRLADAMHRYFAQAVGDPAAAAERHLRSGLALVIAGLRDARDGSDARDAAG